MTLMDLVASLKMDVSNFLSGSRQAKTEAQSLKQEVGGLGNEMGLTSQEIASANRALMEVAGNAAAAGLAFSVITGAIVELASSALTLGSSFQQAEIGFTTMLGSGQAAKQFLDELKAFAAATPFEFPELQRAATRLNAMGFAATAVIPIMRTVGDSVAAAGGGSERINRITLALGQMQAKGRVSAQEMNQLAEAMVNGWQAVADALGISIPEAMRRSEAGAIAASVAIPAILESMAARTGGMMQQTMQTAAGQWSNFKDQISFILADLGRALLPFAQMVLEAAQPILGMLRNVAEGFAQLPEPVQGVIVGLGALAAAVGPLLLAFAGFTAAVSAVGTALGVSGITAIIGALTPILGPLALAIVAAGAAWAAWDNIPAVRDAVSGLGESISAFWSNTLSPFLETVASAGLAFAEFAANIIGSGLQMAWEALTTVGEGLWSGITQLVSALAPLWEAFTTVLDAVSPIVAPILDLWQALLKVEAVLVAGAIVTTWNLLTGALRIAWDVIAGISSLIVAGIVPGINAWSLAIREVTNIWATIFKPVLEFVIQKLRDFLGVIAELPGVKQAIAALNGAFDSMKEKVTGSVESARTSIRSLGTDTASSMKMAKDAVTEAQQKYDEILNRFRTGKATTDDLRTATERLARAKSDFRAELDRAKPRIDAVKESLAAARREYDEAERNVRSTTLAFNEGRAKSDDLTAAHNRMRTASEAVKQATSAMEQVTRDSGVTMNQYSGGIETVKQSLQGKTTATNTAKEATDALKNAVTQAKDAYRQTYDQWQTGLATEDQVIAKHGELQAAIDRLHPERVAERQAQGHTQMMERYDSLLTWFTTNIPKLEGLNEQLITSNARLANEFEKEHQKIVDRARQPVIIDIKVSDRLPAEINAAIAAHQQVTEAYRQLGITSTAVYEEKTRKALEAYNTIKNSAISSIGDQLAAERAYLRSIVEEYQANGQQVPAAIRERLGEIERDLGGSHSRQKTQWETFTGDLVRIGQNLNRDFSSAVIDLFSGQGWNGFKEAGLSALRALGESIIQLGVEYVQGILQKHLKDIVSDIIPSITSAFRGMGSFLGDLFRSIGGTIGGWLGIGGGGGDGVNHNNAGPGGAIGGVVNSGAGAAANAGGEGGMPTQVLPPIMTAFLEIRSWLSDRRQEQDIGRIEVNTRETAEVLKDPNGPMHFLATFLPKLEGIENFNYNVLAPALLGISSEVISKGNDVVTSVNAAKNVMIEAKDYIHDLVFALGDTTAAVNAGHTMLEQIRNLLIDIKSGIIGVEINTNALSTEDIAMGLSEAKFAITNAVSGVRDGVSTLASSFSASLSSNLNIAAATILGGFSTLRTEFDDIDFSDVTMALNNMGQNITSMLQNTNPASAIANAFNQLNSTITSYGSLQYNQLLSIGSRLNTPQQQPIVQVSVVNTSQSISSMVTGQGVRF